MIRFDKIRLAEEKFRQHPGYLFSDDNLDTAVKHVVLKESYIHANENKRDKVWEDFKLYNFFVMNDRFYTELIGDRFGMITIEDWSSKWDLFVQEILQKAENLHWNIENLQ